MCIRDSTRSSLPASTRRQRSVSDGRLSGWEARKEELDQDAPASSSRPKGTEPYVIAPRPLMTLKFLYSLARGLCPFHPDFIAACREQRGDTDGIPCFQGISNPLGYAIAFPRPAEEDHQGKKPRQWASLIQRKGLHPVRKPKRILSGMSFAVYNLSEEHKIILETAGAKVRVIDQIKAGKIPPRIAGVISGQAKVYNEGYRGNIVGFSWVVECLIAQKVVSISDDMVCEEIEESEEGYDM
eukprot:1027713-Amorphochlora_amoeboformis.AAC.1